MAPSCLGLLFSLTLIHMLMCFTATQIGKIEYQSIKSSNYGHLQCPSHMLLCLSMFVSLDFALPLLLSLSAWTISQGGIVQAVIFVWSGIAQLSRTILFFSSNPLSMFFPHDCTSFMCGFLSFNLKHLVKTTACFTASSEALCPNEWCHDGHGDCGGSLRISAYHGQQPSQILF